MGKVPKIKFNNGQEIPAFGLGTWKSKPGEVEQAVKDAIDIGYRHIDCAYAYGNEKEVGAALKAKFAEGVVKRDDIFITSKLWNTFHRPDLVEKAIRTTLADLGLDYLDLYLIHWPLAYKEPCAGYSIPLADCSFTLMGIVSTRLVSNDRHDSSFEHIHYISGFNLGASPSFTECNCMDINKLDEEDGETFPFDANGKIQFSDVDYIDTWKAMEEVVKKGLTKSIGVSNFNKRQLERLLQHATIKPVTNQVECHPYLNQRRLIDFCRSKDIVVTGYSPLGSPDRPWAKPGDPQLLEDPKLKDLASKYKKTPAQILLRYPVDRGVITIPKSVTKSRIQQNFDIFDFALTKEDVAYLDSLDVNGRFCPMTGGLGHPHHPFENDEY